MRALPVKVAAALLAGLLPVLAICAVSVAHAAPGPAQASIVGGQPAPPGKFPWMAFVVDLLSEEEASACTGTVLTPTVVLTAAHCVVDEKTGATEPGEGFRVVTGVVNWTEPERRVSHVVRAIPYPKFVPGTARDGFGDAALLVLETPTTAPAIPIATSANRRLFKVGTHGIIAGWGMTRFGQANLTESLMWTRTVVASDRCEGLWGRLCVIDFPDGTSAACHGDSGGPLLVPRKGGYVEVGITEAGFGKCTTRRPQLYTRTDLLAKWIGAEIAKIEPG